MFGQFCPEELGKGRLPIGYEGSTFHKGFMIQGGDCVNGIIKNLNFRHLVPDWLSVAIVVPVQMAASSSPALSGIDCMGNTALRKIMDGLLVMRRMETVPMGPSNKTRLPVATSQH
ncbi:Peptidyl-prolyl cis-trans isomerase H, partial [Galemys pyrenaicus]